MAKGQQRKNKEVKKPKQDKKSSGSAGFYTVYQARCAKEIIMGNRP